ncbi:hypothetical protein C7M84_007725 [Penaeus vannamei]|uniref:Uncharacterized protein n=1 Tax=Penaeus vannamei TaxID=6689 RepID=A0A3R7QBM1_PENVA|nr:hypothetical protein C7M84_007725 [Penaeus vannamei]
MFDGIREWAIFKTLLRRKFRGTCSSTDFFTILNECRMTSTQGPQDFFQQLEGIVYQGVRDYPDVVGNPEPLLKRLFLQGLPLWLREYLAINDELPLDRLVETAQRIWNTRTGVARTEPLAARHPPRPLRAVAPVEEPPEHRRTRWCSYHRTSRHDNRVPLSPASSCLFSVPTGGTPGEAVVWVVNSTLNPVKLKNGTHLVELHEVEEMCDTTEAPGNVASIADTPVAAVPTSALEKISLKHLSDHRDKFAIGEVPDIVHEIPTQEKHPLCQRQWRLPEAAKRHIHPYAMRVEQLKDPLLHEIVMFLEERAVPQQRPPLPLDEFELRNGTGPDRALGPQWQGPAKFVKKLGPFNYVVQDLFPPFSERNCHANQLRPFKLEEELTFPDASPYHDPDYVDPWLPDDAEPDHSNTSTSCGLSSETDVARTTNSARPYLELPECPGPPLL